MKNFILNNNEEKWKLLTFILLFIFLSLLIVFIGLLFNDNISKDISINDSVIKIQKIAKINTPMFELNKPLNFTNYEKTTSDKLKIIQVVDFECPFSKKFYKSTYKKIEENYINKGLVDYEIIHRPLIDIHKNSLNLALLYECAKDQSKEKEMFNFIFSNKRVIPNHFIENSESFGMNKTILFNCFENQTHLDDIYLDLKYLETKNIQQTPTLIIDGIVIEGARPYKFISEIIDRKLK